ncbi:MAG: hypothetical protein KTR25_11510 [Myxococcales bacterium]|nr:hypothetical protein [Myxococcales bacterium]
MRSHLEDCCAAMRINTVDPIQSLVTTLPKMASIPNSIDGLWGDSVSCGADSTAVTPKRKFTADDWALAYYAVFPND